MYVLVVPWHTKSCNPYGRCDGATTLTFSIEFICQMCSKASERYAYRMKSIFVPDALALNAFETKMAARYSKHSIVTYVLNENKCSVNSIQISCGRDVDTCRAVLSFTETTLFLTILSVKIC